MNKESVSAFLQENPSFLLEEASRLGLQVKNGKIVNFAEVQLNSAESKIRRMEEEIHSFIENAKHNENILDHLFALNLDLIELTTSRQLLDAVANALENHFHLNAYALRLLPELNCNHTDWLHKDYFLPENHAAIPLIEKLERPVCFHYIPEDLMNWLPTDVPLQSFVQIPLYLNKSSKPDGLLIIASANPKRFQSSHDTVYVKKMADAITACLNRLRNA